MLRTERRAKNSTIGLKLQINLQSIDKSTTAKASNTAEGCLLELWQQPQRQEATQ